MDHQCRHLPLKPRWKLNRHQFYNMSVLTTFLENERALGTKTDEELKQELITHGWDVAIIETAINHKKS